MPNFDMFGADRNGLAIPWAPTLSQNGTRTIKATVHRGASTTDYTATVNVAIPIPPLTGAEIRYSLTPDLAGSLPAQGAVKTAPWYVFLNTSAGTSNADVAKVEWFLDGVLQVTDNVAPFQMFTPWNTSDSGSHTITARITRVTSSTPVTVTATLQTETAGPVPGAPFAWPRATTKNAAFGIVRTPVRVFARHTYQAAGDRAKRNNLWQNGTHNDDIEIVLPSDKPLDAMGGIVAKGYRSVSVVGQELTVSRNWAQQWLDDNLGKGKFARGDRQYLNSRTSAPVKPADSESQTCLDFESTQRAFLFDGNIHVYVEGVAITGPGLMEGFDLGGAFDGTPSDIYLQNIDIRTPVKWRLGWNTAVASGIGGHNGGDVLQVWRPCRLHIDDFRVKEHWYQGFILKAGDTTPLTGPASVDARHLVFKKAQGYNNGGVSVYWQSGNAGTKVMDIDMTDEVYVYGDLAGSNSVIQNTWPEDGTGHSVPSQYVVGTTTTYGAYFPPDDQFTLPPTQNFGGSTLSLAGLTNAFGGTFGNPSEALEGGDRYVHYTTAPANTTFRLKAWNMRDKQPDYPSWPGGLNADPIRASIGESTAGMGYR